MYNTLFIQELNEYVQQQTNKTLLHVKENNGLKYRSESNLGLNQDQPGMPSTNSYEKRSALFGAQHASQKESAAHYNLQAEIDKRNLTLTRLLLLRCIKYFANKLSLLEKTLIAQTKDDQYILSETLNSKITMQNRFLTTPPSFVETQTTKQGNSTFKESIQFD